MIFKIRLEEGLERILPHVMQKCLPCTLKKKMVLANVGVRMLYLNAGFLSASLGPK